MLFAAVLAGTGVSPRRGSAEASPPVPSQDLTINPGRRSYDTQPSLAVLDGGASWAAWKAYYRSKERILVRRIDTDDKTPLGPIVELSERPGIVDAPQVVYDTHHDQLWCFWAARRDGQWRIVSRKRSGGRWREPRILSAPGLEALKPRALVTRDGRMVLAWYGFDGDRFDVWIRVRDDGEWTEPSRISNSKHHAFRPTLAESADRAWVFWDTYVEGDYIVKGRPVLPERGPTERVSPNEIKSGRHCFKPTAAATVGSDLYVAWLKVTDAVGGKGVVDQLHALQMARRVDGRWQPIRDKRGGDEAAKLIGGLLPDVEANEAPRGYLGRRREPMLLQDEQGVWLLWERTADHEGPVRNTKGLLLGRRMQGGEWGPLRVLHRGLLDYRLAEPARIEGGRFVAVGSEMPERWQRPYRRVTLALADAEPFEPASRLEPWQPVQLPRSQPPRYQTTDDGREYQLYWADLHCHSGFTCDADGQPDELLLYGRDHAGLDVMVMQDNGTLFQCPLTESEYRLAALHSRALTEPGRFVALPGYEWTQRVPPSNRDEPFNPFEPVKMRSTVPNHRTVIYPPSGGPILRHMEIGGNFSLLGQTVARHGGLLNTQHHIWRPSRQAAEANIEVAACWGIYIRRHSEQIHDALNRGLRRGFVGNSDSHRRNPGLGGGLTGIYAESLTPKHILEALRNRRCFATNGSRIVVDARLNGHLSDREAHAPEGRAELSLTARAPRPIVRAKIIRNGRTIESFDGDGTKELRVSYTDENLTSGTHWYYWEIAQEGSSPRYGGNVAPARGHLAWSSPHWVEVP